MAVKQAKKHIDKGGCEVSEVSTFTRFEPHSDWAENLEEGL